MQNTSTLPEGTTREQLLAALHDHDFMIKCDPHHVKHSRVEQPAKFPGAATDLAIAQKAFDLPDLSHMGKYLGGSSAEADPYVNVYELTDEMPNPVFSSTINSRLEYVNLEKGLWTRVNSPMGVVLETAWIVVDAADGSGALELHQDIVISCSRMLVGIVKGNIEANRGGIHKLIRARIEKEMGGPGPTPVVDVPAPTPAGGVTAEALA
ncbi:uncharacterized protein B0I36DRAFT_327228 [Microdochium trichocladiopsis]|uniref:DUF7053 domain-containing protein n=1 Tax=Microdochium trichocladiopsis TaxID=1682393 RepID=A0A9P9BNK3_9PEZI|nr:uncharacterized protein B0I36DRAFT_327228 [Microdochium trichocladiopsis]KAH7027504.1 hypothetical protein B0I36DRAFT_327228 [Microdochium trichocladiopsis]